MKKRLLLFFFLLSWGYAGAQKTPEQMGGVYYAYHAPSYVDVKAPEGFAPVYMSHYGRHGSRWLPSDERYLWVLSHFEDKNLLTKDGRKMRKLLQKVWKNAKGNGGALTPLGAEQHQLLAKRMAERFPAIFADGSPVKARSSVVGRCRQSMLAFTDCLRRIHPGIVLDVATDSSDMAYIAYTSAPLREIEKTVFPKMKGDAGRMMRKLFVHPERIDQPERLMSELHTIASDMQDVPLSVNLFSFFNEEEIRDVYECNNERMAFCNGNDPRTGGEPALSAVSLWENIETCADEALRRKGPSADLRFGHDTNLYRLLSLLRASSATNGRMDEILPMAANLQMIFYRNSSGDVLVRLLHNEKDFAIPIPEVKPHFYRWTDIKNFVRQRIHDLGHMRHLSTLNTMVGTAQANTQSAGMFGKGSEEHGQTLPAVLTPNGQNFWTPQTQDTEKKCVAPYYYADSLLQGFRASHWIVGGCTQDYGSATIAALGGKLRTAPAQRATRFSHHQEWSHPHFYAVELPDENLKVELTASEHGAVIRITPTRNQLVHVVVNPNSDEQQGTVEVDVARRQVYVANPVHRIYQGWGDPAGFSGHLLLTFSDSLVDYGCYDEVQTSRGMTSENHQPGIGAFLTFEGHAHQPIELRMATSFTSREGCAVNMERELGTKSFLQIMEETAEKWKQRLHTIDVEGDSSSVRQFYGALYRVSFLPRLLSDADGAYPKFSDGTILKADRPQYTDFSMWDTYRAVHPLYNIIAPSLSADMMQSLVNMSQQGGWLPIFPCWNSYTAAMIGDHCAATLADAWVKEIHGFDGKTAWKAMRKNAFEQPASRQEYLNGKGRRALTSYLKYGYIPLEDSVAEAFHNNEQTSRTLEYAFDDFAVAQMAKAMGEQTDYDVLMKRAGNWKNVINPKTGYADGRHANGKFEENTDFIHRKSYITEGAVCHYTWYVPHDPQGLIDLLGGKDRFVGKLDSMFTEGKYWHGNEPCHQVPYMFDYAKRPDLTQKWVRHIMLTEYNDSPGGLSGNDDAGQMSAWYVFAAMGFYPVCPATTQYMMGTPLFSKVNLNLENGRSFRLVADHAAPDHPYVVRTTLNGKPLDSPVFSHGDILSGSVLHTVLSSKPLQNP